jgi:hypothetical protein
MVVGGALKMGGKRRGACIGAASRGVVGMRASS